MDDIVDIDEALSESFCLQSEETNSHVQSIIQQWKQHNRNIIENKGYAPNNVDSRTYTRPKKKMIYDIEKNLFREKPTINMHIGEPVSHIHSKFIRDMSPPRTTSSIDFLSEQMQDSLITSGDFSNVVDFLDNMCDSNYTPENLKDPLKDFKRHNYHNQQNYLRPKLSTTYENYSNDTDDTLMQFQFTQNFLHDNHTSGLCQSNNSTEPKKDASKSLTKTYCESFNDKFKNIKQKPVTLSDSKVPEFTIKENMNVRQSTPVRSTYEQSIPIELIANLSPIQMVDGDSYLDKDMIEDDMEFDRLMDQVVSINNTTNHDSKIQKKIEDIKKKHQRLQNGTYSNKDGTQLNSMNQSIASPLTTSGSERMLRRSRMFDNTTIVTDLEAQCQNNVKTASSTDIDSNKLNGSNAKLFDRSCTNDSKEHTTNTSENEQQLLDNGEEVNRSYVPCKKDTKCEKNNSNENLNCETNHHRSLGGSTTHKQDPVKKIVSKNVNSLNDHRTSELTTKIKPHSSYLRYPRKDLKLMNEKYKLNYPQKTNSAEGLDATYSEKKRLQNELIINNSKHKSHSTQNLIECDYKGVTKPADSALINAVLRPSYQRNKQTDVSDQKSENDKNLKINKRIGLIRPSSGYFSYLKKTDLDGEVSKRPISQIGVPLYSSNGSLNKYMGVKATNNSNQKDNYTEKNSLATTKQTENCAQLKPEVPKNKIKMQTNKRSCLPRPMSMATNK